MMNAELVAACGTPASHRAENAARASRVQLFCLIADFIGHKQEEIADGRAPLWYRVPLWDLAANFDQWC
jgi:hypothetical protein